MVSLDFQGLTSTAFTLPLASPAPALFTPESSSTGPAAALNQNSSQSTPTNPARIGEFISLYATGEGQTSPAGVDGKLTIFYRGRFFRSA